MDKQFKDGNIDWLRERANGIRRKDRPKTEKEWLALAKGLDIIADTYATVAKTAIEAVVAVDVLTSPADETAH